MAEFKSISLTDPKKKNEPSQMQKLGVATGMAGVFIMLLAALGVDFPNQAVFLSLALGLMTLGTVIFARDLYLHKPAGIKNDHVFFKSMSNRGTQAYLLGIVLTGFYIILYWYPGLIGFTKEGANTGLVALFDPLSMLLKGEPASQWFVYGTLYTLAILIMGYKFILKYRHNRYQVVRTISVMFFQLSFAFLLPEFLVSLNMPYNNFANMWPLNYYFFDSWNVNQFLDSGSVGLFMLLFGIAMIFLISPVLTYFYGKRWYCSWVCGCGGLAETAGDPFRQQSDKKLKAWKFERISIHLVTVFVTLMTVGVIHSYLGNNPEKTWLTKSHFTWGMVALLSVIAAVFAWWKRDYFNKDARLVIASILVLMIGAVLINSYSTPGKVLFIDSQGLRKSYGFLIGSAFSGVIGVGFYPILGSRVWCRFGCPMAAILGFQQRIFSKFRITTNGGQCISCGNCSVYCEMGIDVRAYAQKGQNIVRSSCVGCGICSAVCPRGVLKLENGPNHDKSRMAEAEVVFGHDMNLLEQLQSERKA